MLSLNTRSQQFPTKSKVDQEFKRAVHKNGARKLSMDVWLVSGSILKLLHVEIVTL